MQIEPAALRELLADTFVLASEIRDLHITLGREFPINIYFDEGKMAFKNYVKLSHCNYYF